MRYRCGAVAVIAVLAAAMFTSIGCTRVVGGNAEANQHEPGTELSTDGYGLVLGFDDTPVQLDVFIEPQCPHCAQFEAAYGGQIARYVRSGQLAVTYRPLTFFDNAKHTDYSARVANAMFLAAQPSTSATDFQAFVQDLYRHQSPNGPANADIATMARESGVPDGAVKRIAAGDSGIDVTEMNSENSERLEDVVPIEPGTPTIYDTKKHNVVNFQNPGWLEKLVKSG